jgi:hypothetical protein
MKVLAGLKACRNGWREVMAGSDGGKPDMIGARDRLHLQIYRKGALASASPRSPIIRRETLVGAGDAGATGEGDEVDVR